MTQPCVTPCFERVPQRTSASLVLDARLRTRASTRAAAQTTVLARASTRARAWARLRWSGARRQSGRRRTGVRRRLGGLRRAEHAREEPRGVAPEVGVLEGALLVLAEAVEVELTLEGRELGVAEVLGQHLRAELLLVADEEALAVRRPLHEPVRLRADQVK